MLKCISFSIKTCLYHPVGIQYSDTMYNNIYWNRKHCILQVNITPVDLVEWWIYFVPFIYFSPESIKNRTDLFYLMPERSCVPDSPVWFSANALSVDIMAKMLNRIRVVKEVQEAHLMDQTNVVWN